MSKKLISNPVLSRLTSLWQQSSRRISSALWMRVSESHTQQRQIANHLIIHSSYGWPAWSHPAKQNWLSSNAHGTAANERRACCLWTPSKSTKRNWAALCNFTSICFISSHCGLQCEQYIHLFFLCTCIRYFHCVFGVGYLRPSKELALAITIRLNLIFFWLFLCCHVHLADIRYCQLNQAFTGSIPTRPRHSL